MSIRKSQVALHVRVKLNENWKPKSLSDEYLQQDKVIFIKGTEIYNDTQGTYIFVGSMFNTGTVYLNQIDLEFPISDIGVPAPTKLDLKIEELEKDITVLQNELGISANLQLDETITIKPMKGILPFDVELKKNNELGEKTKLLKILKELV